MNAKRSVFRYTALLSGLVSQEQLDQAAQQIAAVLVHHAGPGGGAATGGEAPSMDFTDRELADKLVEMHVLTRYQADQILQGRTKLQLGAYVVTDFIAQGGMGQVFKAVHKVMGRECAVKVLPVHRSTPDAIANFMREIRLQAKLDHPNLVRAFDAGQDGSVPYLVTEYIPGTDLRRLVRSQGYLTMQQAANLIRQAALGLEHAHASGLIHRDMKPGNILVTPEGLAKVSDLGLAGLIEEGADDPRAGKIVGTADYLAPEQIRNPHDVSKACDVYALGCTLYYAVTGKVPFPGGTPASKARRHLEELPMHPRQFNPDVTEEFVEVIADMMEKDATRRVSAAVEVAARLEPWARGAAAIPPKRLSASSWTAPSLPGDAPDGGERDAAGRYESEDDSRGPESGSQASLAGETVAGGSQDTRRRSEPPVPPPLPNTRQEIVPIRTVKIALAVSIVVSVLMGLVMGMVLHALWS